MKKGWKYLLVIALVCAIVGVGYAAGQETIVYVTKAGKKYHTGQCGSLKKSKIEISLGKAILKGYEPCNLCDPPILDEDE